MPHQTNDEILPVKTNDESPANQCRTSQQTNDMIPTTELLLLPQQSIRPLPTLSDNLSTNSPLKPLSNPAPLSQTNAQQPSQQPKQCCGRTGGYIRSLD